MDKGGIAYLSLLQRPRKKVVWRIYFMLNIDMRDLTERASINYLQINAYAITWIPRVRNNEEK